ncbi:MAG: adenylyltransferase/cytidyltransferase family protein [Nanoarchaeota archaeon]|nr:adenylyltransferase/cytidyltransferase family protein [Nanoarchaeota archaeon]
MKRVMVAGTFDIFHLGHEYFLKEARKFGDELIVVIARDENVLRIKGKQTKNNEDKRLNKVLESKIADKVILGNKGNIFNIIEEIEPEVICLGYDQPIDENKLRQEIYKRNLVIEVVRLKSFKPEIYKSSFMN